MEGERLRSAQLGFYGIEGDRRFAFRRANENGGNPWLTAGRLRDLLLYQPVAILDGEPTDIPTHVVTPGERNPRAGKRRPTTGDLAGVSS